MVKAIIDRLKTGSIKNVIPFGESNLPPAPYIVVKQTSSSIARGINYKIFVHYPPGYEKFLTDYVMNELVNLLDGYGATTDNGNYKELEIIIEDVGFINTHNDDKTISMYRSFLAPAYNIF